MFINLSILLTKAYRQTPADGSAKGQKNQMSSTVLAGRVANPTEIEYHYLWTERTKVFGPMSFAEMRLVCRMLNFDYWVDPHMPEEKESVDRNAFVRLAWDADDKAWKIRLIVIHDHAGEALLVVRGDAALLNQKGEHKLFKSHAAVENDIHRLLQPETGEPAICNVMIMTTNRLPSKQGAQDEQ